MWAYGRIPSKMKKKRRDTWLAPRLNERIRFFTAIQTEESTGGFEQTYSEITTIWGGLNALSHNAIMRWSSVENLTDISHELIIRKSSLDTINTEFSSAFSTASDSIDDINPAKANMYFAQLKSDTIAKFFRIKRIMNVQEEDEYLSILAQEIEEIGTGAPNIDYEGIF